ncbi:ketoacyl-synthetase C-terminal extension domain-containing protein [Vibrio sp. PP-XX7]
MVETHGTGTALGDPIEVGAISQVYTDGVPRKFPLYLGSVKTNIGHLEAAAGVSGLVKAALALQHGQLPATLHVSELNQHIEWATVPALVAMKTQPLPSETACAGISAFGLSGTNCHVILQSYPQRHGQRTDVPTPEANWQMQGFRLPLSAKSPDSLQYLIEEWEAVIDNNDEDTLDACCAVAATRRPHLPYRAYFYGQTQAALQTNLRMFNKEMPVYSPSAHPITLCLRGKGVSILPWRLSYMPDIQNSGAALMNWRPY